MKTILIYETETEARLELEHAGFHHVKTHRFGQVWFNKTTCAWLLLSKKHGGWRIQQPEIKPL